MDGRVALKPEFVATPIFWDTNFGLVRTPYIKRYLTHDIYIEPIDLQGAQEPGTLTLARGEERQVGNWRIKFVRFYLAGKPIMGGMPSKVGAVLALDDGKQTHTVTPYWDLEKKTRHTIKVPNTNITVSLEGMNAEARSITLRIDGLEGLHGHAGFLVVNVQRKPAVNLVWIGAALVLLGSLLAGLRRMREAIKAQVATIMGEQKVRKARKVAA